MKGNGFRKLRFGSRSSQSVAGGGIMKKLSSDLRRCPMSRLMKTCVALTLCVALTTLFVTPLFARGAVRGGFSYGHGYRYYPGYRYGYGHSYYSPYYFSFYYGGYYPYYYPYYYPPAYYGPGYVYPDSPYPPAYRLSYDSPPPSGNNENIAWLRLNVEPGSAEVYLDGQYAGRAEEFAGGKKLLPVSPADHTLRFVADGCESAVVDLRINPLQTLDVTQHLRALPRPSGQPTSANPPPAVPDESNQINPPVRQPYSYSSPGSRGALTQERPTAAQRGAVVAAPPSQTKQSSQRSYGQEFGRIIVTFGNETTRASVYVDGRLIGERDPAEPEFMINGVPPGKHRVIVQMPGHEDFQREVTVASNQSVTVEAALQ
jgi:hypothetical protein